LLLPILLCVAERACSIGKFAREVIMSVNRATRKQISTFHRRTIARGRKHRTGTLWGGVILVEFRHFLPDLRRAKACLHGVKDCPTGSVACN
jgi:hypothetical protein